MMKTSEKSLHSIETVRLLTLLATGVGIRLINIAQPYVDAWSWKNGTNGMIAENFYRNGFNIFYPQINWAGPAPGFIGTEFPIVPFIAASLYVPFGVQDWIGRAIAVASFALSQIFLYFLVKEYSGERRACLATAIYALAPLGIFAGRTFIPDTLSVAFSLMALYFFRRWLERPHSFVLFLFASLATALASMVKLPAILIGVPLLYMAWENYGTLLLRRRDIWAFAAISLILPIAWYSHSWIVSASYFPHQHAAETPELVDLHGYEVILQRIAVSNLTPVVTAGMLVGLFLPPLGTYRWTFHWWLAAVCFYIFIAGNLNLRHPWYQLPIVPVAAAFAGIAFAFTLDQVREITASKIIGRVAGVVLFVALGAFSFWYVKPLYFSWATPLWRAGNEVNRITPSNALVVFVDGGDASALYYARRKGWHALDASYWGNPKNSAQAISALEELRKQGASHLVFTRFTAWWLDIYKDFEKHLDTRYRRISQTNDYIIFDLSGAAPEA